MDTTVTKERRIGPTLNSNLGITSNSRFTPHGDGPARTFT